MDRKVIQVGKAQAKALPERKVTVEDLLKRIEELEKRLQTVEAAIKKQGG